jgi:hypothetical protein
MFAGNRMRLAFRLLLGLSAVLVPARLHAEEVPGPAQQAPAPTAAPSLASSGRGIGGHVGVATPLVTLASNTRTIADSVTVLNPIGVSVKLNDRVAMDFEVVVATPAHPTGSTGLIIDPGVVYNWGPVATGLRLAWAVGAKTNVGLIPLINRGLVDIGSATWFVEAAFPTVLSDGDDTLAFNAVLHTGVGF